MVWKCPLDKESLNFLLFTTVLHGWSLGFPTKTYDTVPIIRSCITTNFLLVLEKPMHAYPESMMFRPCSYQLTLGL